MKKLLEEKREELEVNSVPMYKPFGLERKVHPSMGNHSVI